MSIVCIDTQIIVWGLLNESRESQKSMIPRAKALFKTIQKNKDYAFIPAPVLAEILLFGPRNKARDAQSSISRYIPVLAFDSLCAYHYPLIWKEHKAAGTFTALKAEGATRKALFVDCMIVACAVANNADVIYSEDIPLRKLAEGFIEVKRLPKAPPISLPLPIGEQPRKLRRRAAPSSPSH